jgi:hypothetical protein
MYKHSRLIHSTSIRKGYIKLPTVSVIPNMRDVQQIRFASLSIKHFTFWQQAALAVGVTCNVSFD